MKSGALNSNTSRWNIVDLLDAKFEQRNGAENVENVDVRRVKNLGTSPKY